MFGIGGWELVLIIAVALLVLGPKRLPAAARSIGRAMQQVRKATGDLRRSVELDPDLGELPRALDDLGRPMLGGAAPDRAGHAQARGPRPKAKREAEGTTSRTDDGQAPVAAATQPAERAEARSDEEPRSGEAPSAPTREQEPVDEREEQEERGQGS